MPLTYTESDEPSEAFTLALSEGLDSYNFSAAPSLADVKALSAAVRDADGVLIGGALGRTWGLCCELQELWVVAEHRNGGVGSTLLQNFERHGRLRGCTVFYLTTLSFQAPDFYKKQGYQAIACIAGYPDGFSKYLMHKSDT